MVTAAGVASGCVSGKKDVIDFCAIKFLQAKVGWLASLFDLP
jgi:hypothetical protein